MTTRDFDLGDILSITTGRLVSPRHIEGVYDILNYMTGESLYTHQLGRAMQECAPELRRQHPDLSELASEFVTRENWRTWLDDKKREFGPSRLVTPLPSREPHYGAPIADLIEMLDGNTDKIVVVDP